MTCDMFDFYITDGSGPEGSVQPRPLEVNTRRELTRGRIEATDKETESGSCSVNVAVCLAVSEERTLHQLQLRPKGLMDKTTQQGSRVRRPLSARANWSLRPEFTPTFYGEIHTHVWSCSALTGVFHQKALIKESSVVLLHSHGDQSGLRGNNQYPSPYISTTYSDFPSSIILFTSIQ